MVLGGRAKATAGKRSLVDRFPRALHSPPDVTRMIRPIQCRYAPRIETSSGLAWLGGDAHRSGGRARACRQFAIVLCRDRQDRRCPHAAGRGGCAQRRTLAAHLLRGICPGFPRRRLLRIQLRAFDAMGGLSVQRLPKRHGGSDRNRCARNRRAIKCRLLHLAGLACPGSLVGFPTLSIMASRLVGGDRGCERPQVVLGVGASTGESRLPSLRLLCA